MRAYEVREARGSNKAPGSHEGGRAMKSKERSREGESKPTRPSHVWINHPADGVIATAYVGAAPLPNPSCGPW